jgi:signal transduction histidine kinase
MGELLTAIVEHNTLLAGMILFVLGIWLFFRRQEDRRREPLAGLLIYTAFWLLSFSLRLHAEDPVQRLYWYRTEFFIISFLPVFHYAITAVMVTGRLPRDRFLAFLMTPNLALLLLIYIFPITVVLNGNQLVFGPVIPALWLHFAVMVGLSAALLLQSFTRLRTELGSRLLLYLVGMTTLLGSAFAVMFGGAYGLIEQNAWIGGTMAMTSLAGLLLIVFAVDSREFATRMKPVGLELLLLVVMLAFIMDLVLTPVFLSFSVRLVAVLAVIMYGAMAVRALSREVTQLRESEHLQTDLTHANEALHETDLTKTRLLSFASHQLRAILAGIRGYTDMLYNGDFGQLTDRQHEIVGVTLVAADRLGDTVDMFLDVAKIEGARLQVDRQSVLVAELVERAVQEFVPLSSRKGLSLVRDVPDGLTASLDAGKLYHAIANLIHNAINYTDKGGVEIVAREDDDWLTIVVKDSGMGMDEAARAHVRELLEQGLNAVRFEESGGSGLGLYIAKAIVLAHGGEMIADSSGRGLGSTFGFRIPLK